MENRPITRLIAFTLFIQQWLRGEEDVDFFTDEHIADLYKKWETQFLPSLKEEHCGDCTNVPMSCTRCTTEELLKQADRIWTVTAGVNP